MLDKNYVDLIDEVIARSRESADAYIEEHIDPIAKLPRPDVLVGHPYPFSPIEMEVLKRVYVYDSKPLERFIAKAEVGELDKLEQEVALWE